MLWQDADQWSVYLPAGASRTGQVFAGGQSTVVRTPLETIPVFLREGRQAGLFAGRP